MVFGLGDDEVGPDLPPIDDNHPRRATAPYGMSKRIAEDMCQAWSERTGRTTIVLRPVSVLSDDDLSHTRPEHVICGSFVHVDDVADAVVRSLEVPFEGHARLLLGGAGDVDCIEARRLLGGSPDEPGPPPLGRVA